MNKTLRFTMILITAGLLSASCTEDDTRALMPGDKLPEFSVAMSDGTTVTNEDLSEGESLVVFFNTSCKDCRDELPVLQELYDKYGGRIRFCLISREETSASIRQYWLKHGLTMPYSAQDNRKIYSLFAQETIPRCYLSKFGIIFHIWDDNPIMTIQDFENKIERYTPCK